MIRRQLSLILSLLVCQFGFAQTSTDSSKIFKVLSFNILHGATTRGDFDLDAIAKVIVDTDPDLVALQEVDNKTRRAQNYDLATELGWRTKMNPLFARAMPYDGGEYGEAVLSKYSFISTRNVPLPFSPGNEPRAALEVTICVDGDTISFVGTHLDHTEDESDRIAQAKALNAAFENNQYPTLLVGDLNALPESIPILTLKEKWAVSDTANPPANTYPSGIPIKKIDYVMYRPIDKWKVLETKIINDTIASDHCAFLVTIKRL
ncbi:MAG: endonuclease/exonuclease/phosphatase family metal-dependent hydrolase [Cyclobacteriaceae bacterium]|jgi:endonuclease/exonuclease/phosphatase family metal-dependent hydrolase